MYTRVATDGWIRLPAKLRKSDGIQPGQCFQIERLQAGEYLLSRRSALETAGLLDWLLDCPEKGWFQPVASESTGELSQ